MRARWLLLVLRQVRRLPRRAQITRVGPARAAQPLRLMLAAQRRPRGTAARGAGCQHPRARRSTAPYRADRSPRTSIRGDPTTRSRVVSYLRSVGAQSVRIDATGLFAEATHERRARARVFGTPLAQFRTAHGVRFVAPAASAASVAANRIPAPLRGACDGRRRARHASARDEAAQGPVLARPARSHMRRRRPPRLARGRARRPAVRRLRPRAASRRTST